MEPAIENALLKQDLEYIKKQLEQLSLDIRRMSETNSSLRNDINIANGDIVYLKKETQSNKEAIDRHEQYITEAKITFRNFRLLWAFATSSAGASIILVIMEFISKT